MNLRALLFPEQQNVTSSVTHTVEDDIKLTVLMQVSQL